MNVYFEMKAYVKYCDDFVLPEQTYLQIILEWYS